jgi:hypothetical protein
MCAESSSHVDAVHLLQQRLRFGQTLASLRGAKHRFGTDQHADTARLAGLQREQQAARLKIGAADVVDQRQADGHGAVNVDPLEVGQGDVAGIFLAPAQAAQLEARAVPQNRQQGAFGRRRQHHADFAEHDADDLEAALDVAADEELLGGAAAAVEARRGIGAVGGQKERVGGLGAAAGVDERLAVLDAQSAQIGRLVLAQANRCGIQLGGAIEGKGVARHAGGALGLLGGASAIAGGLEVAHQRLRGGGGCARAF